MKRALGRRKVVVVVMAVAALAGACSSSSKSSSNTNSSSGGGGSPSGPPKYPAPAGGNGGATAPGVSATSIRLFTLVSTSGPLPGATENAYRGTEAYLAYINSLGGVYGRKLYSTSADDAFQTSKSQALCTQYIPSSFAIVGSFSSGDSGCEPEVKSSGIPFIGGYLDPQYYADPNVFDPGNSSALQLYTAPFVIWKREHPNVSKIAILYDNVPGVGLLAGVNATALDKSGFNVVLDQGISPTNPNLTPYIIQARDKGAQGMYLYGVDVVTAGRIAQDMVQQGWDPALKSDYAIYESQWHSLAGSGAAGWETGIVSEPFLCDSCLNSTPGGALFLKWFKKLYPKQALDTFAVDGWVYTELFVDGLIAAGANLTRADLLAAIKSIHSYNADGLYAPTDPGSKTLGDCDIEMLSTANGFTQAYPPKPNQFACGLGTLVNI